MYTNLHHYKKASTLGVVVNAEVVGLDPVFCTVPTFILMYYFFQTKISFFQTKISFFQTKISFFQTKISFFQTKIFQTKYLFPFCQNVLAYLDPQVLFLPGRFSGRQADRVVVDCEASGEDGLPQQVVAGDRLPSLAHLRAVF
jgi:hypothetical protein